MLAQRYLATCQSLLEQLRNEQLHAIEAAAEAIAQAIADGHTFYAWGGPHSSLPVQDIFYRAGGLSIVNPLFAPGLSLEQGPIRPTSFLERAEGYGTEFFHEVGAEKGDVILLVSTSGRNAFPVEMAIAAKVAGLTVIGMTSLKYSEAVPSRHSSGKKMYECCDIVLDNLTVPGDAVLSDPLLPQRVGPTSGWMGCLLLQATMVEVAERLAAKGIKPPIYFAANLDGQDSYVRDLNTLIRTHGTRFGGTYSPVRGK